MPLAPDVQLSVSPRDDGWTVVGHFVPEEGLPATTLAWLDRQVRRAVTAAGFADPGPAGQVRTGI